MSRDVRALLAEDRAHLFHPYASAVSPPEVYPVESARGVRLTLMDGRELVDGIGSWWSAIHGHRVPELDDALRKQAALAPHVMLGGLTHAPVVDLATKIVTLVPSGLSRVFFSDSGSVAVEVAIKMAIQYFRGRGRPRKCRLMTVRGGYHGDTFLAMSVCDPEEGMHTLFRGVVPEQIFAERPTCRFGEPCEERHLAEFVEKIRAHRDELAAVILEPVLQGAGGMYTYSSEYLARVRELCDEHDVLFIADEIATGFGRTGKLFACEHAGIRPDILCLGKALTGGVLSLAATLATEEVTNGISAEGGVLMHGPTFMGNPLACAVSLASIELLLRSPWRERLRGIEDVLRAELEPCRAMPGVSDVRVLGAMGAVELTEPADVPRLTRAFVDRGVWLRPFGRVVYTTPPFVMDSADLRVVTGAIRDVVQTNIEAAPKR
jgi:adenosylmethionine-8-amino-7-oxononanoate aminotransferase